MKTLLVFSVMTLALAASEKAANNGAASDKPQTKAAAVKVAAIPAGARQSAPGVYRFTGNDGKVWIYRQTPFGISRVLETPAPVAAAPAGEGIRATEDGDTIRFERPGPFGTYRWQRKKTELDETERAAWERSRTAAKQD